MACDNGAVLAERVKKADHVGGHVNHRVVLDRGRGSRAPVAAQIRGDSAIAGLASAWMLVAPGVPQLGEAMKQHDCGASPGLGQMDIYPAGSARCGG